MTHQHFLDISVTNLDIDRVMRWRRPCQPRILVVTDGSLNYMPDHYFGLWRFLHGITLASGVTNKPALHLAHRGMHAASVTIGTDTYSIATGFNFAAASPALTIANYDQIWMFGIDQTGSLTAQETAAIAEFMNSGGGVFATGDHANLGKKMCGALPRIRHMREWNNIPMGTENDVTVAVSRIDTVVNPGANNLYEFADQSDDIPQRIYPNYKVTQASPTEWQATLHPLLRMPGTPVNRTEAAGSAGFTNDMDVLPDHPHESVCYEVTSAGVLGGAYTDAGLNFEEFRPSVAVPASRVGAEIVAYAVSGGRSVLNGVWKPPVKPQMFGVISAYDGRLAQAYPGKTQRPGRIVCESTWHHYVNINLDGTGTGRSALGSWSGGSPQAGTFTPSATLEKIYTYYRNAIAWLQPANRVWCSLWWDMAALRFNPALIEELIDAKQLSDWRDFVGLGRGAAQLLELARGQGALEEMLTSALLGDVETQPVADLLNSVNVSRTTINVTELQYGMLGGLLARMAQLLPLNHYKEIEQAMEAGPAKFVPDLVKEAKRMLAMGARDHALRAERTTSFVTEHARLLGASKAPSKREEVMA